MTTIQPGRLYLFTKSCNEVRAIAPAGDYRGEPMWAVERVDGESAGKHMDVPARALDSVLYVRTPSGRVRLVLAQKGRTFTVTSFALVDQPDHDVAFAAEAPGFENLDTTSDIAQVFNLSSKVRYRATNVVLGTIEMRANSIEELEYALKQAKVRTYNHEEI